MRPGQFLRLHRLHFVKLHEQASDTGVTYIVLRKKYLFYREFCSYRTSLGGGGRNCDHIDIIIIIIIIIILTTIPNNKPDIIIRDNEKGTCVLIDVAISGDRNVIKIEAEKILKYKDLTIEIQRMWNVKAKLIPVIIGATGTISKTFRKYVSNIPGNHEVKELQKTTILGTAHILRKVLM